LRTIEEAKLDAAEFVLSQIYPQSFVDHLNEYYATLQNAQNQNTQTSTTNPPQTASAPTIIYQNPNDSIPRTNLLLPNSTLQQTNSSNSPISSSNNDINQIYNSMSQHQYQQHVLNSGRTNAVEYVPNAASLMQPQYIVDPSGILNRILNLTDLD
jgi:hypothetical protein